MVTCDIQGCGKKIVKGDALLFSPSFEGSSQKWHICNDCYSYKLLPQIRPYKDTTEWTRND